MRSLSQRLLYTEKRFVGGSRKNLSQISTMLNYSSRYGIDLIWTKNFPIRRLSTSKSYYNAFIISVDSTQCWCISPRILVGLLRYRLAINFAEAFWLPEISFRLVFSKRERSFYCNVWLCRWKANVLAFIQNCFSKKQK
jgi:hypothetical protein